MGSAQVDWGKQLSFAGKAQLAGVDLASLQKALGKPAKLSGRLKADAAFSTHAKTPAELREGLTLDGPFEVLGGVYQGVDLSRAGELAGIAPTGIKATNTASDLIALDADCVLYMRQGVDWDEVCAILESGKNIASTRGEFHNPKMMDPEARARVEEACRKGGTSVYTTGSSPGFSTEALLIPLLSMQRRHVPGVLAWLAITGLFGLAFLGIELYEFSHLIHQGAGPQRSAFLSSFFALVGTHGLHVTFGIVWLVVLMVQVQRYGLHAANQRRLLCLSMFWHFLDVVWIGVFTFVYLMGVL